MFKLLGKYQLGYFSSFPYVLCTTCNYTNGKCIHLEQERNFMKKPNLTVLTHANILTPRIFFIANLKEDLSDWSTLGWVSYLCYWDAPMQWCLWAAMWCDMMWWSDDLLFNLRQALPQWCQTHNFLCIWYYFNCLNNPWGRGIFPHLLVIEANYAPSRGEIQGSTNTFAFARWCQSSCKRKPDDSTNITSNSTP